MSWLPDKISGTSPPRPDKGPADHTLRISGLTSYPYMTRFAKIRQLLSRPSHIGPWGKGTYKAMRWGIFKTSQLNKLILKNPKTSQIYHLNKSSLSGLSYAEEGSDWRRAKQLLKDLRNKIKLLKEKKLGLLSICMLNSHRNWKISYLCVKFFFFFLKQKSVIYGGVNKNKYL